VPELDRGCEFPSDPSPIGGDYCWIQDDDFNERKRCVPHGKQISKWSCLICNTSRDPTKWTPAELGTPCNNGVYCDGPDRCAMHTYHTRLPSTAHYTESSIIHTNGRHPLPQCRPIYTEPRDLPCYTPSNTCDSFKCSEKYHCNAPPQRSCTDPTQWSRSLGDHCEYVCPSPPHIHNIVSSFFILLIIIIK
jgi:hypothetical protein